MYLEDVRSFGWDSGVGNLVGVQTYMETADYASAETFFNKLDGYLVVAEREGWLRGNSIVIFPEYIGTWLAVVGERDSVYRAETINGAMTRMVLNHPGKFLGSLRRAKGEDKVRDSVLRMKADQMAQIYQDSFSKLARRYGVTIAAGSIVLPEPVVREGRLVVGKGELQNIGLVFRPDGSPYPEVVRKIFPTQDELPFTAGASVEDLPVYETPCGRLAVLICADSWYPAAYKALAAKEPALIAVPNNEMPAGNWDKPWQGYDPGPPPEDVDREDYGRLTSGQAWLKYALAGRMGQAGAMAGMHVFFRGEMWDLSSGGHTIIVHKDGVNEGERVTRAAIVNYWLS